MSRRRAGIGWLGALALVAGLLAVPAGASGASAGLLTVCIYPDKCGSWVRVTDVEGASNDLRVSRTDHAFAVTDRAAPLVLTPDTGATCTQPDQHTIRCAMTYGGNVPSISLDAGGGSDVVILTGGWSGVAVGGPGDDIIKNDAYRPGRPPARTCPIGLTMDGGPGDDTLWGASAVTLSAGNDTLRSPSPACPLSGEGWSVDLFDNRATRGADVTTFNRIATVDGGSAPVLGSGGADVLSGWGVIDGRAGNDRISAGGYGWAVPGHTRVRGGPGSDVITVTGPVRALSCGTGRDIVLVRTELLLPVSQLSVDCEVVHVADGLTTWSVRPRPAVRAHTVDLTVTCETARPSVDAPPGAPGGRCAGSLAVAGLATPGTFSLRPGHRRVVHVPRGSAGPTVRGGRIQVSIPGTQGGPPSWWIRPVRARSGR